MNQMTRERRGQVENDVHQQRTARWDLTKKSRECTYSVCFCEKACTQLRGHNSGKLPLIHRSRCGAYYRCIVAVSPGSRRRIGSRDVSVFHIKQQQVHWINDMSSAHHSVALELGKVVNIWRRGRYTRIQGCISVKIASRISVSK